MISITIILFILSIFAPSYVLAKNDWSVPCVTGSCSWDTGDGKTTAYSSMAISGTNNLLSDITPAAGWNIQGCDPNWESGEHTFQMTCSGTSQQTALCSHLFDGGAENTIVRLPANCGKGPFARVVSISNPSGSSIARRKGEGEGSQHTIKLDYEFSKIPTSRGKATFAITSTNIPGLPGVSKRDLVRLRGRGRTGALHRRKFGQLFERGSFSDAASSVGNFVGNAASAVTSAAGSAATAIGNAVSSANTIDKTFNSGQLTPVNFDKDVTLFDQSISCNSGEVSGSASLKVDVDGKVQGTVSFGATIVGTIVPPDVSDFSVNANLGGSASATFTIDATAQGQFGTGKVSLFKTGLPGLSIPSVITIGPEFSVDGSIDLDLEAEAKMVVNAGWDFPSLKLVFPESKGGSSGSATVSGTDNPLQLSADPSVDISGTVTGHLIPRVDFGIDLFGGTAQASVFIDADTSASVNMEVKAEAQINNTDASTSSSAAAADPTPTAGNNTTDTDAAGGNNSTDTDPTGASGNSTSTDGEDQTDGLDNGATGNSTSTDDPDGDDLDDGISGNSTSTDDPDGDASQEDGDGGDITDGLDGDTTGNSTSADADDDTTDTTEPDEDLDGDDPEDGTDPTDGDIADDGTDPADGDVTDDGTDPADGDITDDGTDPVDGDITDDGTDPADDNQDGLGDGDDDLDGDTGDGTEDDNSGLDNGVDGFDNSDPADDTDTGDSDSSTDSDSQGDDGSDAVDDGSNDFDTGADDGSDTGFDDSTDDSSLDDSADDSSLDDSTDDSGFDDGAADDSSGDDSTDDSADDSTDDSDSDDTTDDSSFDDTDDDTEDQDTTDDDTTDDPNSFFRKRDDSGSVSGCVTVNGAIDVTAGLTGSLEPFISDATTSFDIFSTQAQLFQRCLGGGQERRRALRRSHRRAGLRRSSRRIMPRAGDSSGLQCPAKLVNALTSLI